MGERVGLSVAAKAPRVGTDSRGVYAPLWRLGLARLPLLLFAASAVASCFSLMSAFLQPPLLYLRDFVQDWLWARALRDGVGPYEPTPLLAGIYLGDCCPVHLPHATPHPPLAGLLVLPLSWLDLYWASLVWAGIELGCLAIAIALLVRRPWLDVIAITGALLAWHAARTELVHGQFTTIQLLLLVLARQALGSKHENRAGILVGLALCIKPIVAPLVLLFVLQRRAAVLAGIGYTVLAVGLLSLFLLGTEGVIQYLSQLPHTGRLYQDYELNISVWVLGWKLVPQNAMLAIGISLMAGLFVVAGVGALIVRTRHEDLAYGAVIAACTILTPIAWDIYAVLVLLPVAQIVHSLGDRGWPRHELAFVLTLAVASLLPPVPWIHPMLTLVPMLVLVAFTFYVGIVALGPPLAERSPSYVGTG